jgi:hypothetical protein
MLEAWQLVAEPFGSIEAEWRFKSAACPVLTAVEPPKNVTRSLRCSALDCERIFRQWPPALLLILALLVVLAAVFAASLGT